MKKITWILICTFLVANINAQDITKKWTLEACIDHAITHNIDIKQRELRIKDSEVQVNTEKMSRLPNLNASVGQSWNFGRSQGEFGLYESRTLSNSNLSVTSSTPIFTGFRINNKIGKSQLDLQAAYQNLAKAKDDLSINVTSLFLQSLFNKELLKVAQEQLNLSLQQVERTRILVDAGKVPSSQLYDIQAQVAKDEVTLIETKNNLELSLLDLAQSLELENIPSFDIETPENIDVIEQFMSSVQPPQLIFNNAVSFKAVIKEQEYLLSSAEKSLKIAQSQYLPTLDLNLGFNTQYFYDKSKEINDSFHQQIKNNSGEYIGLSLNIPIFNRFSVKNQVKSAQLNIQNQQLNLENTKKSLYKEIQTAYLNAIAAQEKYNASTKAVIATKESYKYAEQRYEIGKTSVFEFNESKTKLIQSLSEEIQAKYDYIFRSKILDFYNGIPIKL